jgi:hypothetical protein
MALEIAFIALIVILGLGEWYVYDRALWWHADKGDPRNFPPPR